MKITASAVIEDTTQLEMRRISQATGKKLRFLYKEAIEEYARNHRVSGRAIEQSVGGLSD